MMLIAAARRLRSGLATRRGKSRWQRQPRLVSFLRELFDLSVRPATPIDFAARCVLLVLFAFVCHGLGAGVALFVKAAPASAAILFGALFAFVASNRSSGD